MNVILRMKPDLETTDEWLHAVETVASVHGGTLGEVGTGYAVVEFPDAAQATNFGARMAANPGRIRAVEYE